MKPVSIPLEFTKGDDASVHLLFTAGGTPFDLTGWTFSASVRPQADPNVAPIEEFVVTLGPGVGEMTLRLEEDFTSTLPRRAYWSLRAYHVGTDLVQTWLAGNVRIDYTAESDTTANEYTIDVGADDIEVVAAANVGPTGATGAQGAPGLQGVAGEGVPPGGTTGQSLVKATATDFDTEWSDVAGGSGGAPTDAGYLVSSAHAGLSGEVVVGTTPGGELGGTWSAPTVDTTHAGSAHLALGSGATQAATGNHAHSGTYEPAGTVATHSADTTDVHGIADTSTLATTAYVSSTVNDHSADATHYTTEQLQDAVGAMVTGGTETGIAVTYDDTNGRLDFVVRTTVFDPRDYGAAGNGTTDDTVALQATVTAMQTATGIAGGILDLRNAEYKISDTIFFTRFAGVVQGSGWTNAKTYGNPASGTTVKWAGTSGTNKPMFEIRDSQGMTFDNIKFQGAHPSDTTNIPTAAIRFRTETGDNKGTNAKLNVDRCYIGVFPYTNEVDDHVVQNGVLFDGGADANNDEYVIERSKITGCTVAGISFVNHQSTWGTVKDTLIDGSPIGLVTNSDTQTYNLHFNNCTLDYSIVSGTAWVFGYSSENAKQFIKLGTGSQMFVWGGDLNVNTLVDTNMIDCYPAETSQILSLQGVTFDLGPTTKKIRMRAGSAGSLGASELLTLRIIDCFGITSANLDVNLLDANDKRDVFWSGNGTTFSHSMRGSDGTLSTTRTDPAQPLDADLTAIAALSTTSYGRSFLALADAAAGRTLLGLGTAATSASTAFDAAGAAAAAQAASQPLDSDLTAIAALTTTTLGRSLLTVTAVDGGTP